MPIQHTIRPLQSSDFTFFRQMISLAANWRMPASSPSLRDVERDQPQAEGEAFLARYVSGWGRRGDVAFVAIDSSGNPIGTSSYRLFTADVPGYGFVDERTPEISLAVVHAYRRNGVGTALLNALLKQASTDGYTQVSLSVNKENPALRLYQKAGFTTVATQPNSLTMVCFVGQF